ncbi:MAG: glycosyltransferase family 4 protein [Deltaproteobacteria bacterium]|nr:glycosyltransferase family 4 protein [Deltaproteobacteria bacterium]
MKLAFVLFKYFPYGGLQRDCIKIARECLQRGHYVDLYCLEWQGPEIPGVNVHLVKVDVWLNYRRYEVFSQRVKEQIDTFGYDGVVGFNRMAGLDLYFGADPCFALKCEYRKFWYRFLPRSKSFLHAENEVYGLNSSTQLMLLSDHEIPEIQRLYGTPIERFQMLPPGVDHDRLAPADYLQQRLEFRHQLEISDSQKMLLMVGSGFRTKGVDRALDAMACLPEPHRQNCVLFIVGRDNSAPFERQARQLGLERQVRFMGGRDDASKFFFAADLLIHPAYREAAGMVLLEAVAAQLPVLVTDSCGYSFHIERSQAGRVHSSPFDLQRFSRELLEMLEEDSDVRQQAARDYIAKTDIFGLATTGADVIERVLL